MNENLNFDLLKYDVEKEIISPMPTDALLHEREVAWKVRLPDDYKEFIKKENGLIPSKRYFHFRNNEKVIDHFLAILAISGEKAEEVYDIGVVSTQLEGRIVFDVSGEERAAMTVQDLLDRFKQGAGSELNNDRILFSE